MFYPLCFQPIFQERVWGGRNLERLYGKALPPGRTIGESWEICDRPEGISQVINGPFAGRTLRWLMENYGDELLGPTAQEDTRFPLLVKILDAQEKLSLQVHPPQSVASRLGGEPKSEIWSVAEATPEAELFLGLKHGVTRTEFERRIADGTVAEAVHRVVVRRGDSVYLPSGRVHAIGAGNVIFEIQQNSDTTYRVFDWNRVDSAGKARELHVPQSLESIDFGDCEPDLIRTTFSGDRVKTRELTANPHFSVSEHQLAPGTFVKPKERKAVVLGVLSGIVHVSYQHHHVRLAPGQFCLVPACLLQFVLKAETPVHFLEAVPN